MWTQYSIDIKLNTEVNEQIIQWICLSAPYLSNVTIIHRTQMSFFLVVILIKMYRHTLFFGLWQCNVTMVVLWARLQIERSILPMLQLSTLSLSLPPYLPPSASSVHFRVMPSYADGAAQLPRSSQQIIFEKIHFFQHSEAIFLYKKLHPFWIFCASVYPCFEQGGVSG